VNEWTNVKAREMPLPQHAIAAKCIYGKEVVYEACLEKLFCEACLEKLFL